MKYLGYSTNKGIREKSASGGVVTSLMLYLIENDKADGALVCKMDKLKPIQYIATTREEIISSCQSKYLDFYPNVEAARGFNGRLAVIGTPCQLVILKKSCPQIRYWFGLYCGNSITYEGMEKILERLGIPIESVSDVKFREGSGYGNFQVAYGDKTKSISKDAFNYLFTLYAPKKCLNCTDFFNGHSDISFGDCWIKPGFTSIYPKNNDAVSLLLEAETKGYIRLEEIDETTFFSQHSHSISLKGKKIVLGRYNGILNRLPFFLLSIGAKILKRVRK